MWLMFGGHGERGAIELTAADLPGNLIEDEAWMGAYFEGRKLGYVHARIRKVPQGYALWYASRLRIVLEGHSQSMETSMEILLEDGFRLSSFSFGLDSPVMRARMEGRAQGDRLHVRITVGDRAHSLSWPLQEPPLFAPAVAQLIARRDPTPGVRYRVREFDPRTMSNQPVVYRVVGREAISWAGKMVTAIHLRRRVGGRELDTWVDESGRMLREKLDLGLLLEREDQAQATFPDASGASFDQDARQLFDRLLPAAAGAAGDDEEP